MKYCIICSAENEDQAVRCRICNGMFFSNTVVRENTTLNTHQILCSNCKKFISPIGFVCPHCGYSVEASRRDMNCACHLKLTHRSGGIVILSNNDIIGKSFNGKEIFANDPYVSRMHIRVTQAGKFFVLEDISSGNSFFVNRKPIARHGKVVVSDGDILKIGVTDLEVHIIY